MDDKILEAFVDFKCVQQAIQIKKKLDEHEKSWEEFAEWVQDKAKRTAEERTIRYEKGQSPQSVEDDTTLVKRRCPRCSASSLHLIPVNECCQSQVGGNWKSMWYCEECDWDQLSRKSVWEEKKPYIVATNAEKPRHAKKKKKKSRIIMPNEHRMLYYGDQRRRRR
jgi:hypothetical protein